MAAVAVAGGIKYEQLQAPTAASGHLPSATALGATSLQPGGCSGGGADGSSNLTVTHLGPSFLAHRASCAGTSSPTHPPSSLSPPPPAGLPNSKVKNIKYAVGAEHHMLANMYKPNSMGKKICSASDAEYYFTVIFLHFTSCVLSFYYIYVHCIYFNQF